MRSSDWSSDVCSSDLVQLAFDAPHTQSHSDCFKPVGFQLLLPAQTGATCYFGWHWLQLARSLTLFRFGHVSPTTAQHVLDDLPVQIGRASCRERVCQYV